MIKKYISIFFILVVVSLSLYAQLFQLPIKNSYITAAFGEYRNTGPVSHFHLGIDFSTFGRTGLPVYSGGDGYLYKVWINDNLYGNAVFIMHEDTGLITGYAHLQSFSDKISRYVDLVSEEFGNQRIEIVFPTGEIPIKANEIIANSGATGEATAPHLHFEVLEETSEGQIIYDALEFLEYQETRSKQLELIQIRSNNKYFDISDNQENIVEYAGVYPKIDVRVREKLGDNSTIVPKKVSLYINDILTYKVDFSKLKEDEVYNADIIYAYASTASVYWIKMYSDYNMTPIVVNDFSAFSHNTSGDLRGKIVLEDFWGNEKTYNIKFVKPY
ncbi:MAG: M23 family metallopeptidase [Defluviitoga tunisiensis]|uniref:Peptidase M23B n=1 Tax=Defluviitoga tunisiensis TaxID=1006576 RepID=A0A0C7NLY4_DEFTU|nr:M23 family metallopeptidase [Defluviitoga tunisiensis]MDD3600988.1 M23 family metallopeptidase [Defluviitoga tunisiensis]MDY0379506.1 M23 family metallopeptidase [Defluviitoga tunisiensis]CEP78911.1 peptidase M23B [Defluviitoga tunisiensis]HHV02025.1 M23 family metallopeptidase [Defluviitoga tunisiensis]HOB55414.1 M23 family metallopeptidase [Defluviitoga tunisiensis]